jgi:hypothetical protein
MRPVLCLLQIPCLVVAKCFRLWFVAEDAELLLLVLLLRTSLVR